MKTCGSNNDGALPHYSRIVRDYLGEVFQNRSSKLLILTLEFKSNSEKLKLKQLYEVPSIRSHQVVAIRSWVALTAFKSVITNELCLLFIGEISTAIKNYDLLRNSGQISTVSLFAVSEARTSTFLAVLQDSCLD
ncbi:hypothetical protein NQ317_018914 [Molorchus minor]|uniref:Uncharacterized protein n=1 Tax=Molorchus minor TaxID=1323400 RepID=A0ABQ9JLG5_9CUCU|nr:hypothetical protein NQ317_018914 [Molorchus minor]